MRINNPTRTHDQLTGVSTSQHHVQTAALAHSALTGVTTAQHHGQTTDHSVLDNLAADDHPQYIEVAGDDVTGILVLDNAIAIRGRTSGGTGRDLIVMAGNNTFVLGTQSQPTQLLHNGTFTELIGADPKDILSRRQIFGAAKASDESLLDSTVMQDDNELVAALLASTTYRFYAAIKCSVNAAVDIKTAFTLPSGASGEFIGHQFGGTDDAVQISGDVTAVQTTTGYNPDLIVMTGQIVVGGTPGNFQFQWAQRVSSGTPITVQAGSVLEVQEIAA